MFYFVLIVISSFIPYLQADPTPDTNVQIQNYDGPIYLHSPKPNYCPLCNSVIHSQKTDLEPEKVPCESDSYPRKAVYGSGDTPVISGNTAKVNPRFNPVSCPTGSSLGNPNPGQTTGTQSGTAYVDSGKATVSNGITKSFSPLNSRTGAFGNTCSGTAGTGTGTSGSIYPISVTFESAHTGESGNCFCGGRNCPTITGTECTCVTKPLSSFLPPNSAQNSNPSYKIPILTYNQGYADDEPILVPQKFSYALILDGEVAPTLNQNQNYPSDYCIVL